MLAALLLTLPVVSQDPAVEVARLRETGRLAEALEVAERVDDPGLAARLAVEVLWHSAGDLRGALTRGLRGLEALTPGDDERVLLWNLTELALQLDRLELAQELLARWERAIDEATDLSEAERAQWHDGWAEDTGTRAARARWEVLRALHTGSAASVRSARLVAGVAGLLSLLAMGWLSGQPASGEHEAPAQRARERAAMDQDSEQQEPEEPQEEPEEEPGVNRDMFIGGAVGFVVDQLLQESSGSPGRDFARVGATVVFFGFLGVIVGSVVRSLVRSARTPKP